MRIKLLTLSYDSIIKLTVSAAILYIFVVQLFIPLGSILMVLAIISLFCSFCKKRHLDYSFTYLFFLIITSAFSLVVAENFGMCISYLIKLVKTLAFLLMIMNAMRVDNGFVWIRRSAIVSGVALSFLIISNSRTVTIGNRVSASDQMNENVVAATIAIAVLMILYEIISNNNKVMKYICYFLIGICSFAVLFTGTRKSFFAIVGLVVGYLFFIVLGAQKSSQSVKRILFLIVGLIAVAFFINYAINNSLMGQRFQNTGYEGDKVRSLFYTTALNMLFKKPIFGYGWGGFENQMGMYSHSTYAELIANTGILGTILFFVFYFGVISNTLKRIKYAKRKLNSSDDELKLSLLGLFILLFFGIGTAIFYDMNLMICLGISLALIKMRNSEYVREGDR